MSVSRENAHGRGVNNEPPTANGHSSSLEFAQPPPRRSIVRALIQDFSPVWVTWSMNTGILALLMHSLPYQFPGLRIISTILFVIDLVFFILCSTFMVLRFVMYGKVAWTEITSDVNELCFMSCYPIAWMTLTILTAMVVSTASWGGHAFTILSYTMWWISVLWTLTFGVGIYIILSLKPLTDARNLSLAIVLPAVATSTAAVEGAFVSTYAQNISSRLAVPVIVTSFMLVGVGFFVALLIYALFLQRILANDWFDGVKRPTLMILLGPTGQSASALLALAAAVLRHFPGYSPGPFFQESVVIALHGSCVMFALMMFGLGLFWLFFAVYAILHALICRQAKWTPAWYATVFPTGTMCSAMILFSEQMDSPAFRVLATGLLLVLVIAVLANLVYTVRGIARRQILIVAEDPRLKKQG